MAAHSKEECCVLCTQEEMCVASVFQAPHAAHQQGSGTCWLRGGQAAQVSVVLHGARSTALQDLTWYFGGEIRLMLCCRTICVVLMLGAEEITGPFGTGSSAERTMEAAVAILCRWFEQPSRSQVFAHPLCARVAPHEVKIRNKLFLVCFVRRCFLHCATRLRREIHADM